MAYKELDKTFGAIVRSKRKKLEISQERFSELVGISTVYCRDIEIGKSRPNWVIWMKICAVLEIDINSIMHRYISPELNDIGEILGMTF